MFNVVTWCVFLKFSLFSTFKLQQSALCYMIDVVDFESHIVGTDILPSPLCYVSTIEN